VSASANAAERLVAADLNNAAQSVADGGEPPLFRCLYCNSDKPMKESTLEHAVPQFLGGASAPLHYRLRNVCARCNSVLGLHVDASYARSWTVTNGLAIAARKLYTGLGQRALPLVCIGIVSSMPGLTVPIGMAAEFWVGPSGENIIWIRSESDTMYWYSGGNPIDKKTKLSTLYYIPTTDDPLCFQMGLEAFNETFKKAKARRIFGARVVGGPSDPLYPGFDGPTEAESANLAAFHRANVGGQIKAQLRVNFRFDHRFICKMVLAVGYSLFGEQFLGTETATQARLGLWPKPDQQVRLGGIGSFGGVDATFSSLTGYPGAVALTVQRVGHRYVMILSIDQQMPFITELAPAALSSPRIAENGGYALLLFPQLRQHVELEWPALLAHKLGNLVHAELALVDEKARQAETFNSSLPPLPTRPPLLAPALSPPVP
jgi:hypothetical protein